ncbi:hypothetical protein ONZ45_g11543 [Pleurotus djamor]|nr:hypothetical protein ONZ45_g11543 [Pleurotus djamor]
MADISFGIGSYYSTPDAGQPFPRRTPTSSNEAESSYIPEDCGILPRFDSRGNILPPQPRPAPARARDPRDVAASSSNANSRTLDMDLTTGPPSAPESPVPTSEPSSPMSFNDESIPHTTPSGSPNGSVIEAAQPATVAASLPPRRLNLVGGESIELSRSWRPDYASGNGIDVVALHNKIDRLEKENEALRKDRDELRQEKRELKEEIKQMKKEFKDEIQDLKNQIQAMRTSWMEEKAYLLSERDDIRRQLDAKQVAWEAEKSSMQTRHAAKMEESWTEYNKLFQKFMLNGRD